MVPFNTIEVDTSEITDWNSFHSVFARVFGFPGFYGRNMDAWIDCMTYIDETGAAMTKVHAPPNGVLVLYLKGMEQFRQRCPEITEALESSCAFVNYRRLEVGGSPILVLSYYA